MEEGRKISVLREGYHFARVSYDGKARGLVFSWGARTNISNTFAAFFVVLGLSWLPIRWEEGLSSPDFPRST